MANKEKLEQIYLANASPEERLVYEKKKLEKKVKALQDIPPEMIKGDPGRNPLTTSNTPPLSPQIGDLWFKP